MVFTALLVAIFITLNGGVFSEYFNWVVAGSPLITGSITGLLCGDFQTGALVGAGVQLVTMGNITVAGVNSFDKRYASIIGVAVTIVSHQSVEVGITLAVSLGAVGLIANNIWMTVNVAFVHMADKYVESGETKRLGVYNWLLPNLVIALVYGVPAFLAVYFGAEYLEGFMSMLPAAVTNALTTVGSVLPALGIAMMLKVVYKPKFVAFVIIGYLAVAYMGFNIMACAILGVACAVLYWAFNIDKLVREDD